MVSSPVMIGPDVEDISQSSMSSPSSQKASIVSRVSQTSEASLRSAPLKELTPLSSIPSEQDFGERETGAILAPPEPDDESIPNRKRTANGQIKSSSPVKWQRTMQHSRNLSSMSNASTASLAELSEALKTKLSYAMLKVQNGWQNHSLSEIESLASLSTKATHASTQLNLTLGESPPSELHSPQHTLSRLDGSYPSTRDGDHLEVITASKSLAPSATIVSASSRRAAPSSYLRVNTSHRGPAVRPSGQQRTPSQNAAMEADAVETLLFMSASPSTSSHFPTRSGLASRDVPLLRPAESTACLVSSSFPNGPKLVYQASATLDDDFHDDIQKALSILDAHKSARLST